MTDNFAEWGFRVGRLFGIEIKIHWTYVIFAAMWLIMVGHSAPALLFLGILFLTILIHELGHMLAARHFGLRTDRIIIWPFGGLAMMGMARNTKEEFWITFWGPFVHIPMGLAAGFWLAFQGGEPAFHWSILSPVTMSGYELNALNMVVAVFLQVQIWLFAFNVFLPAYPMDGGRMLVALLLPRLGALKTARTALVLTSISACFLMFSGTGFIACFLFFEAAQLYQWIQTGAIYSHPSFSLSGQPLYSSQSPKPRAKASRSKELSHLRLVGTKQCPKCGRTLPEAAKMCGFCEISV